DVAYDRYARAGTAHILAVSGLHIGIVAVSILATLRVVIRSRRWRAAAAILLVFGFALMAGGRVSALRAATMVTCYLLADLLDREPDTPSALALAALLFLVFDPGLLFEPGFQLSFLSVSSILLFAAPIDRAIVAAPTTLRR